MMGPHVVVTGAGGFIGRRVVARMLAAPEFAEAKLTLVDIALPSAPADARVRLIEGDLCDPAVRGEALAGRTDILVHLAGILGGAAEANYDLSRRVNIDATLSLFEALRDPDRPPRVVFASSIAVFGVPLPDLVDDETTARPTMTYGAQKLMMEIALDQFSRRGWIDGVAIRLPGVVANPHADSRQKAAFLSRVFSEYAAGRDYVLPVSRDGASWLISVPACVEAFAHAALIPPGSLGSRRAMTLPAQRVTFGALVDGLAVRFPESRSTIGFAPDPALEAQFGCYPPLDTSLAASLGFRHDGDIATLIARALS
jgi:nucleoside-diphosphate-sugar epimerase